MPCCMKPCLMRCCSPMATRKSFGRTDDKAASTPASCNCSTSFCGDKSLPGHTLTAYAGADLQAGQAWVSGDLCDHSGTEKGEETVSVSVKRMVAQSWYSMMLGDSVLVSSSSWAMVTA